MELAHEIINHLKLNENAIILDCAQISGSVAFKLKTEDQILQFEVSVKNVDKSGVIINAK